MVNRWEKNENSGRFSFLRLQNHCGWWPQPWNSKTLAPWKKSYDKLRQHIQIFKSRDIILPTKDHIIKAMVFPVVMYGCESWTIKKAEHWRTDAFELRCWRRCLRVPWTAKKSSQSILKEINPEYSLEGLMLKLKLQCFGHLTQRANSLEKALMLVKDWGQEEKGLTEDEMVGCHHQLNGHEFKQTAGDNEGQGGPACCNTWGHKELDTT